MGAIGVLRMVEPDRLAFFCPGCQEVHAVTVAPHPAAWSFNGNHEAPTFGPSILIQSGHYAPGHKQDSCWCTYNRERPENPAPFKCTVCHSFVIDGKIQFLGDCTHALAGQTVALAPF